MIFLVHFFIVLTVNFPSFTFHQKYLAGFFESITLAKNIFRSQFFLDLPIFFSVVFNLANVSFLYFTPSRSKFKTARSFSKGSSLKGECMKEGVKVGFIIRIVVESLHLIFRWRLKISTFLSL